MNLEKINLTKQLKSTLDDALFLNGRTKLWRSQTRLYGNIPDLDCMSIMNVILALEVKFKVFIDYEDYNGEVFSTIDSLSNFVYQKLENEIAIYQE